MKNNSNVFVAFIAVFIILLTFVLFDLKVEKRDNEIAELKAKIEQLTR